MRQTKYLSALLFCASSAIYGQFNYIALESPLNFDVRTSGSHTSIWPARLDQSQMDSLRIVREKSLEVSGWWDRDWMRRKLSDQHLVYFNESDWGVFVDPVLQLELGNQMSGESTNSLYRSTRGAHLEGRIGSQFTFETTIVESQLRVPDYLDSYISNHGVIPGEGLAKPFGEGGWDHRWSSGNISFTPSKYFNFSLGQGKFFYGEGYRSMLLSDNALNYPYFRIESTFGPFKYVNLWMQNYDIRSEVNLNPGNRRKWVSSHYFSWDVTDRLNFGLFEAIVYGSDTLNGGLDVSYFNPIIMYRPIEDQIDSRLGNALLGLNASYKFNHGIKAYGQFVLDEFNMDALTSGEGSWLNKFGFQLGVRQDVRIREHELSLLAEANVARPFTYTHKKVLTNYAHFNQPLAHPLGTDFIEYVFRAQWRYRRWSVTLHYSLADKGLANEINGHVYGEGADLWTSYENRSRNEGFELSDEPTVAINNARVNLGWTVQSAWGMEVFTEFGYRSGMMYPGIGVEGVSPSVGSSTWLNVGFRTLLYRRYTDI